MEFFGLLLGHLVGDYIFQNDWVAKNKVNSHPGPYPEWSGALDGDANQSSEEHDRKVAEFVKQRDAHPYLVDDWIIGHVACVSHCVLYTLAVWAFSFWWMPWWGLVCCFVVHFPVDRWRLAAWWMRNVSGQAYFASKEHPLFPWSIVVVDNTFHLLTLFAIATVANFLR